MALQVWLPLRGDLTNYGLSKFTFGTSATNITIDDNGKIGKCYKSVVPSGANSGIYSADNGFMAKYINHKSFSICAWFNTTASNTPIIYLSYGLGLAVGDTTHTMIRLGDSTRTISCGTNMVVNDGVWHHVAGTYDTESNKIKIYIDGVLKNTVDYVSGITYASSWTNGLFIYRNPNNSTLNEGYFYNGKANDIRVYDHCLSGQEVKDISMGLVAHYQLKDSAIESTTNLVTRLTNGGQTTLGKNNMSVITSGANSDTYFTINLSENIVSGTQYTISCDVKGMVEGKGWTFPIGSQSNTSLAWVLYNGHNEKTFTANDITWGSQRIFMDDNGGRDAGIGQNVTFYNFQVEKKDHATVRTIGSRTGIAKVYDSSGFGNHATTWAYDTGGEIVTSESGGRYKVSTYINSNNNTTNTASGTRYIYGNCELTTPTCLSVAFWCKPIAGYGGNTTQGQFSLTNNAIGDTAGQDYNTAPMNHRDGTIDINSVATVTTIRPDITFTANEWHHYAVTYDGRYGKVYKDGALTATKDMGSNKNLGNMKGIVLGFSRAGGVWRSNKSHYSDFRLYVTALSAEDVKSLYQTAAHTFQNGYSAYEFVEG